VSRLSQGANECDPQPRDEELKKRYMPKLISGEWTRHDVSDRAQCAPIWASARPRPRARRHHWKLTGTKIWISFGEHDMADNIIHLVLARLPGAPPGSRAISLFIVPKSPRGRRAQSGLSRRHEHKMGIQRLADLRHQF